jgi:hypothetical protein
LSQRCTAALSPHCLSAVSKCVGRERVKPRVNPLKAFVPLSATVRRRLQRRFFVAGPTSSSLQSALMKKVMLAVLGRYEIALAAPCLIKHKGSQESRSRRPSLLHFALRRVENDAGGKIHFTRILGQILSSWFNSSGLQWQAPPRYEHGGRQG